MSQTSFQTVSFKTIDEANAGQRLDNFLLKILKGVPKTYVYRIIRKGEVRVNKKRAQASTRLEVDDLIRIPPVRISQSSSPDKSSVLKHSYLLDQVLYEDDAILVLNKPSGLAVHSGSGLQYGVIELYRQLSKYPYLELVHRLDRFTSGCLLMAKKRSALTALNTLFAANNQKNNLLDKRYLCLAKEGLAKHSEMVIQPLLKRSVGAGEHKMIVDQAGQFAKTRFHMVKQFKQASLLEAKLFTGRTHQVRVHAKHLNCPLAGDEKYGDVEFNSVMREQGLNRLFLHASQLTFPHPLEQRKITISAKLPVDLQELLDKIAA